MAKIEIPHCDNCGSTEILFDAWATIDPQTGAFELFQAFSEKPQACEDCGQSGYEISVTWEEEEV